MNNPQAQTGGADAQQRLPNKVNQFLFDLKNEACEHGFKAGESWTLQLATDTELTDLKRFHHPIISLRLEPVALLNVYQQVKDKLKQSFSADDAALTPGELAGNEKKLLVAFPARITR